MERQSDSLGFSKRAMGACAGPGNVYEGVYEKDDAGFCTLVHWVTGSTDL